MIRDFIAIDFETANQQPSSVCSVGVVMVRNGQVADSFYSLIQPEPNYYNYWCQLVHGLSRCRSLRYDSIIHPVRFRNLGNSFQDSGRRRMENSPYLCSGFQN